MMFCLKCKELMVIRSLEEVNKERIDGYLTAKQIKHLPLPNWVWECRYCCHQFISFRQSETSDSNWVHKPRSDSNPVLKTVGLAEKFKVMMTEQKSKKKVKYTKN